MEDTLRINDVVVAPEVVETIVRYSAEKVDGVAAVGYPSDINGVFSFFSQKKSVENVPSAVTVVLNDGALDITLRLAVLFGYPFINLADSVRTAVAEAVESQIGAKVRTVDVLIDSLLFPKE